MTITNRLGHTRDLLAAMTRAGLIAPLRPDRYLRIAAAARREGATETLGFAIAAQRCPDRAGLIDELGTLTWRQLEERIDALAAALQSLPGLTALDQSDARRNPRTIGIMCRNHRGFVQALVAAHRVGADAVLLNTAFAGPALADVVNREGVDMVIYDEEFTRGIDQALTGAPDVTRILAWTDDPSPADELTVENLINANLGRRPTRAGSGKLIMLTSGTTGAPKGAKRSGGGIDALLAILRATPWRAEQTTVVVAPMFHAWGFSQLVFSAMMACTVVTRRKFDPEATLALIDRYRATGLGVVPVMIDRIMALPQHVRARYDCRSLRFAAASGSRMRPDAVLAFMDEFGDVIYNNYNGTEVGMVATATPADLRAAPDTAGRPVEGAEVRILDDQRDELPTGEVGQIFVRNTTRFEGYTSGATKESHDGFMATGDLGYLDEAGRLFVVSRDDEMIVSGGENVYPIEVEKTLTAHPDVAEAAVIGVDDDQFGQRLAAFAVLLPLIENDQCCSSKVTTLACSG